MRTHPTWLLALALAATASTLPNPARADTTPGGFGVEVLVDGRPVPEYPARGTRYIEALKGVEYPSACATRSACAWPLRSPWTG